MSDENRWPGFIQGVGLDWKVGPTDIAPATPTKSESSEHKLDELQQLKNQIKAMIANGQLGEEALVGW